MKTRLDKIDLKILEILQNDCRITTKKLAERLNLSPTPVFERIKKLEKEGYIDKYVALLNERKIGLKQTIFIGVKLKGHTRSYLQKFLNQVNDFKEVTECYQVSGNFDFLLKIVLADIDAYEIFVQTKLSLISELGNVHSYIAIKKGKCTTKLDLSSL
ncbi:Lrp/AsnC family transcriptional regulator [Thalassobellus suaedae]|uniref:Lrp/AsnC family transcriptional regulator n=1 Tax=Thalassobellus suaedae TaxID=3074124 RepID=A0ABY9XYN0_9FLAO|nr:Lrp/AsnC family transcriptional regulator [Flavobacteriaceae bacterium HL-DH14]WNH12775.1 Lrp/AsnC family transcriptional regulator [Flavobacteriaceae bacterium HL-DH10]